MISLPSRWVKANKLDKGYEIDVSEKGNHLLVSTDAKEKKEIVIEISDENRKDVKNILTHAYRSGFDKIILNKYQGVLKEVKEVVNDLLLGFEVTEISANKLSIESISEPTEQKYDLLLKKSFQIIDETQNTIINDFKQGIYKHLEDIGDSRKQQDRFLLFCRRLLVKEKSAINILANWEFINSLMHIEHAYYYLYKFYSENKIKANSEMISLLELTQEYFKMYEDAHYNKNINSIHKINKLRDEYYFGKCIKALSKYKGEENVIFAYIREIFRIIQLGTSAIFNDLLDSKLSS